MTMDQLAHVYGYFPNPDFKRLPAPKEVQRNFDSADVELRNDAYANALGMVGAVALLAATASAIGAALVAIAVAAL